MNKTLIKHHIGTTLFCIVFGVFLLFLFFLVREFIYDNNDDAIIYTPSSTNLIHNGTLCNNSKCDKSFKASLFQGYINDFSAKQLSDHINSLPKGSWLCLSSPGGISDSGNEISALLQSNEINTCSAPIQIPGGAIVATSCGSACARVWLSGSKRLISTDNAFIGFHAAYAGKDLRYYVINEYKTWRAKRDAIQIARTESEEIAFEELYNKGSSCDADHLYRIGSTEARRLKLISSEESDENWRWIPDDPEFKHYGLPHGGVCDISNLEPIHGMNNTALARKPK
ncbi:hypothetical protein N5C96_09675 [Delftia tsuruhatensis]|uniref:hypothetical protein n=1 Tax=Delftia tsuruhatensis TaxID=180282 RepID=UPI00244519C3|nr:hypothetical protein [Delftia tsuruhatensis]MDH0773661.1 hypothetical protein [Delftia tsuruhatensis]MDH1461409.1 hypothetical protein [Delftia tsuruhatensis]MDH1822297.1 hypothetical protein [Delftia tsuruhatensis]WGG11321.1 hypothetical protein N5O86_01410 [Delftia tsuruhatensis]